LYHLEKAAFSLSTFHSLPHRVTHYLYDEIKGGKNEDFTKLQKAKTNAIAIQDQ
jgi:hypothetical protein